MVIPDGLNLLLAGTGLAFQISVAPAQFWIHALSAAGLLCAFWFVRHIHRAATGRVGLGLGDVKMAGAAGIWLSPWNMPTFVFCSTSAALIYALARKHLGPAARPDGRQPFGPFLAAGLTLTWVSEQQMFGGMPWQVV